PSTQRTLSPRFTIQLNDKMRFNVNLNYNTSHSVTQGGNYSLTETGSTSERTRFGFQVSENSTLFKKLQNEIRFQFNNNHNTTTPSFTTGQYAGIYGITVTDAFTGGPAQNQSDTTNKTIQIADQLRGQFKNGKIQINTGFQIDYSSDHNFS